MSEDANFSDERVFFREEAKAIFIGWEKLRIPYNLVLIALSYLLLGRQLHEPSNFIPGVFAGIAANVFYFLGPAVESYAAWLGYRQAWIRTVLYTSGLLFSMAITFLACQPDWLQLLFP